MLHLVEVLWVLGLREKLWVSIEAPANKAVSTNNFCDNNMGDEKSKSSLIAVIGDEDTVTGFLLAGTGHRFPDGKCNFLVVDEEKTTKGDIEKAFKEFTSRKNVSVVLINQVVANDIRHLLTSYDKVIPTVLEIPSKDHPYDEDQDPMMQRWTKSVQITRFDLSVIH
eukprot:g58810.t1